MLDPVALMIIPQNNSQNCAGKLPRKKKRVNLLFKVMPKNPCDPLFKTQEKNYTR